ncbi:MAG: hypothetical protein M0R80_10730 [Proteobacteria bacterium]|nr:hypothetical protein [Pseudomonadota bacterium]
MRISALSLLIMLGTTACASNGTCSGDTGETDTDDGGNGSTGPFLPIDTADVEAVPCAEIEEYAQGPESPVDIVMTVTMGLENQTGQIGAVRSGLNALSSALFANGIDAHVFLISDWEPGYHANGVCIDSPLGSGVCPNDNNPPLYYHPCQMVYLHQGLYFLHSMYDVWKDILRPGSVRHLVSAANLEDAMTAEEFVDLMDGVSPPLGDFRFHAFTASLAEEDAEAACAEDPPHPCCAQGSFAGEAYTMLADVTGGVFADICGLDMQPIVDVLSAPPAPVPLSCEWTIPAAPEDEHLLIDSPHFVFTNGDGEQHAIARVDGEGGCADDAQAWFYDDATVPTSIIACPQTCDWLQADLKGSVRIELWCSDEAVE